MSRIETYCFFIRIDKKGLNYNILFERNVNLKIDLSSIKIKSTKTIGFCFDKRQIA